MCDHEEFKNIEIHLKQGWIQYALGDCVHCPITCLVISRKTPLSKWKRFNCSHSNSIKIDSLIEFKEQQNRNTWHNRGLKHIWAEANGYCTKCKRTIRMYARYKNIWRNQKIVPKMDEWKTAKMEDDKYVMCLRDSKYNIECGKDDVF